MSDYFPLEVIIEILQKLPVKSLMRFMCVCKAWKSIITNDSFIISHHQHFQTNQVNHSLFLHCQHDDDIYDDGDDDNAISTQQKGDFCTLYGDDDSKGTLGVFKFPPVSISSDASDKWKVYGTCNGLVCFTDRSLSEYDQAIIWNPSILKYLILPKPTLKSPRIVYYGLGFDSLNHDFKVVRFASPGDTGYTEISFQVEIFSLAAHSWRSITVAALPFHIAGTENKFVNGALHWLAYRIINGMDHDFILTFDCVEEKFGEVMLPHCLKEEPNYLWSILTGGNLLALNHRSVYVQSICNIWVMKEYGSVESWTQLFRFDSTSDDDMEGVLALWNNNEVVIEYTDQFESCNFLVSCVGDHMESLFLINEKNVKSYLPV